MSNFRVDVFHHFVSSHPSGDLAALSEKVLKMSLTQDEMVVALNQSNTTAQESLALVRKVKVDVATLKTAIENGGPVKPEVEAALAALNETLATGKSELTALDAETDDPVTP